MSGNIIENAKKQLADGKIIILCDDERRENEGDFVQASEYVTAESVNFMITYGKGLLCQTITVEKAKELKLGSQSIENTALHHTAFTVTVDAKKGTSTGISAQDRATTIKALVDERTIPEDLAIPGHILPIIACDGGVRVRAGHTEGSVDLVRLAGKHPNAIICEILNKEGKVANRDELVDISKKFDLPIVHIKDLVEYLQGESDE